MILTDAMRKEIRDDIELCDKHTDRNGSEELYNALIAKYSVIDVDFANGIPKNGKAAALGSEFDYRSELKAISSKLKMWLIAFPDQNSNTTDSIKGKVNELIERGEEIKVSEYHPAEGGFPISYVSGPNFDAWMGEINIFNERYLKKHPLHDSIHTTYFFRNKQPSTCDEMLGHLRALATDSEFFANLLSETGDASKIKAEDTKIMSSKVFIVHGHDNAAKLEVARTLEKAGFEAVILHEQASGGKTVIEKIEANTDVAFAVVLYTPCDLGRAKEDSVDKEQSRARQNVVFEHGYLIGKLGRDHVCALIKDETETPGDISGVVYIPMDDAGAWKMAVAKDMQYIGLPVDMNKFCL